MRRRSLDPLSVMIRERFLHSLPAVDPEHLASSTSVHKTEYFQHSSKKSSSSTSPRVAMINADPFVTPEHSVFDIRIKRVISCQTDSQAVPLPQSSPIPSPASNSLTPPDTSRGFFMENQFHEITSLSPTTMNSSVTTAPLASNSLAPHRITTTVPSSVPPETSLQEKGNIIDFCG